VDFLLDSTTLIDRFAHTGADDVSPGEIMMVECDLVMMNDLSGPVALRKSYARSCLFRDYHYRGHSS